MLVINTNHRALTCQFGVRCAGIATRIFQAPPPPATQLFVTPPIYVLAWLGVQSGLEVLLEGAYTCADSVLTSCVHFSSKESHSPVVLHSSAHSHQVLCFPHKVVEGPWWSSQAHTHACYSKYASYVFMKVTFFK